MATQSLWVKGLLWLTALAALGFLLVVAGDLVVMAVMGGIFAYLFFPLVNRLERRGMSRTLATSIVFFSLMLLLVLLGWLTIPLIVEQAASWQERWADGRFYTLLDTLEADLAARLPFVEPGSLGLSESARLRLEGTQSHLLGYATDALSLAGNLIVVPFVMFFLLRDGATMQKKLVALVPNRYFEFAMGVLYKIDAHLGGYLRGQFVVALFVGLFTTIGLAIVGVDYYVVLGLFTGLANFIPYVGFVISAVATIIVSVLSTGGLGHVFGIVVVFAIVQSLENVVLQPWITARNVAMHPVTVLVAILIGERVGGVLGMALAVPAFAILKVIVVETVVNLRRFRL